MSGPEEKRGPLAGVRIVEIAGIGALPFAGMLLADMGAEIIRIEPPQQRGLQIASDDPVLRGRAQMVLDLKETAGRDALLDLLSSADVLLEALRPGKLEALGLAPDTCLAHAPWLVIGRSTGWGQDGPLAHTAGHDPNYVGYTGALDWLGRNGRPGMPPFGLVGDVAGGSLYLVMGVLAALLHARETGKGQVVDASILDGTLSLMTPLYAARRSGLADNPHWSGMMASDDCPYTGIFETADGRFMTVCALEEKFYQQLLECLGLSSKDLPNRYDISRWPELKAAFADRFRSEKRDHWEAVFAGTDACASPVLTFAESEAHPANVERGAFQEGIPAPAPRFSSTPSTQATGQHTASELLSEWRLRARKP